MVLLPARQRPRRFYQDWWQHTPRGFLIRMIFFIFGPCGFYLDCGFSKVPGDVFIRKIFHLLPLWFFRYHSSTSNPCGFYSACGFQKVTGEVFIRGGVFRSTLYGFYSACGFHSFTRDVFIPPAASIWQGRVQP